MRARWIRRANSLDDCKLPAAKERQYRLQAGMQAKKSVEIEGCIGTPAFRLWNRDGWAHAVIIWLAKRHNDVEAVHRAPLEQHDHFLFRQARSAGNGSLQEGGQRGHADHRDTAAL